MSNLKSNKMNTYKVYKDQSLLKIYIDTEIDLTGKTVKVKWDRPDDVRAEKDATITDFINGICYYEPPHPNTLQEINGVYTFWVYITETATNRTAPGEPFKVKFNIEGK